MGNFLYIFLDEAGNFDFSPTGTRLFLLTCLAKERPFMAYQALTDLKYDLAEEGLCISHFHATSDKQVVRDRVFDIIQNNLTGVRVDCVIVDKCKTNPAIRDPVRFYPMMMGYLLKYVFVGVDLTKYQEVIVFTDAIPLENRKQAIQKAIKETLARMLPAGVKYRIYHHESRTSFDLQIVDYFNWALYRKHNSGDMRSYSRIMRVVKSEFDIFRSGTTKYY